jgi:hypothetical protein
MFILSLVEGGKLGVDESDMICVCDGNCGRR